MPPIKLGLAGCGPKGAQVMYAPILRFLEHGQVTALMDPDPAALAVMRAVAPGAATFTDYDRFLAQADMDAVIVASPVFLHCEQVTSAARAGKHVLCEKPMARTVAECDRMIAACRENGVTLMVAFMKRFDVSFQLAHQLIAAGELGEVFQARCEFSWHIPGEGDEGWRAKRVTWGGMFQDHGSHTIDLCRWWLGDVARVSAEMRIVRPEREVEDAAFVTLRHTGGAISHHHVTGATHKPLREVYLLDGTKASLEMQFGPAWSYTATLPFQMTLHEQGKRALDVTPRALPNLDDELRAHSHYLREIEHFCQSIQAGREPLTTGEDGRAAIEAINAAYLSAWRGETVQVPLSELPDLEQLFRELAHH
jgi:UDP-N-acetyl-2-amino-2-deoxyglucuronate dehydrogenase